MLKLWKNCDVLAPAHLGKRDILIIGDKIHLVEADPSRWEGLPGVETLDLGGARRVPRPR